MAQTELVNEILGHWEQDKANAFNPDRQDALAIAKVADSIETAIKEITEIVNVVFNNKSADSNSKILVKPAITTKIKLNT